MVPLTEIISKAIAIRKELHRIPELCWQEVATAAVVAKRLDELAISWRPCAKTGIVATIAGKKTGEHLALRADMDGLALQEKIDLDWQSVNQGRMHGCGHDGHMATMLATAEWLKLHEDMLSGPVSFIFQPAEEGGYGARAMIGEGALEGVDKIFGWHNWPSLPFGKVLCPAGPVMAANGSFQIVIEGSGGHASQPDLCADPVLAASAVTMGLQQVVSRRLPPQQAVVLSVTSIDAASPETIIPDRAVLGGSVRLENTSDLSLIKELIESAAESIAAAYNTSAEVSFSPRYPAVVNDPVQALVVQQHLSEIYGAGWLCEVTRTPLMASEDFSYYLEKIPGAFAIVGAGDGGMFSVPCHNSSYQFNDQLIEPMVRLMSAISGISFDNNKIANFCG